MITRRKVLLVLGAAVLSPPAFAQKQAMAYRVGILSSLASSSRDAAFVLALMELGYTEGKNIHFERRYPGGNAARIEQSARELLEQNVQVVFAPTTIAASIAKRVVNVPIVFATAPDPVGSGLVASLARPSGNATGTTSVSTELNAKRLQLLKEAFPRISRLAVVKSPEPVVAVHLAEIERAATSLGLSLLIVEILNNRKLLVELAARSSLPAVFPYRESVEVGGLMSYGADFDALYRRAATYIDRILRGAKPEELPVEQPTKFELVVNIRTAKALPANISPAILSRADKIIE